MSIMSMLVAGGGSAPFTPLSLFTGGVQGVWYDPSDLTTMFEDSAGTTPVHTPGNGTADSPVGKILDKSGNANHATQSTSTARPTLSARYNLATYTEQFDNAIWGKANASVTANQTTAPDGTSTADLLIEDTANSRHILYYAQSASSALKYTWSVCAKAGTRSYIAIQYNDAVPNTYTAVFDLNAGTVTATNTSGTPQDTSNSITALGGGWYRCTVTARSSSGTNYAVIAMSNSGTPSTWNAGSPQYTGDGTSGVYIWGADLRVTNDGVGLPAYQRVVDANTYDSTGFPYYLKFDGVDDCLFTASTMNLTASNKACMFSSFRRLANGGIPVEFGSSAATYGSMSLYAGNNSSASGAYWNAAYCGTGGLPWNAESPANYNAPLTNVISNVYDISAPSVNLRINGSLIATGTSSVGTGNFGNNTLYFGRRNNASFSFNGRNYGLIIRGGASSATDISNTETWLNNYTKAY